MNGLAPADPRGGIVLGRVPAAVAFAQWTAGGGDLERTDRCTRARPRRDGSLGPSCTLPRRVVRQASPAQRRTGFRPPAAAGVVPSCARYLAIPAGPVVLPDEDHL